MHRKKEQVAEMMLETLNLSSFCLWKNHQEHNRSPQIKKKEKRTICIVDRGERSQTLREEEGKGDEWVGETFSRTFLGMELETHYKNAISSSILKKKF